MTRTSQIRQLQSTRPSVEDAFYRRTKDGGKGELRSRITRWFAPGVGLVREVIEQDGQAEKEYGVVVSFTPAKP